MLLSIPALFASSTSSTFAAAELVGGVGGGLIAMGGEVGGGLIAMGGEVGGGLIAMGEEVGGGLIAMGEEVGGGLIAMGGEVGGGLIAMGVGVGGGLIPLQLHVTWFAQLQAPILSSKSNPPGGHLLVPLSIPSTQDLNPRHLSVGKFPVAPAGHAWHMEVRLANSMSAALATRVWNRQRQSSD
jgi:hypothetical protein